MCKRSAQHPVSYQTNEEIDRHTDERKDRQKDRLKTQTGLQEDREMPNHTTPYADRTKW